MYDNSETASKPGRFELGKSEKNRRNLKLIQTCDFFILCILYRIFYNVSRRDVNFLSHHIQFIFSSNVLFSHDIRNLTPTSFLPARFLVPALRRSLTDCSHGLLLSELLFHVLAS